MRTSRLKAATLAAAALVLFLEQAASAAISIDGTINPGEWTGAHVATVGYSPIAPEGNFGAPTGYSDTVPYNVLTKTDANYFYVGILAGVNGTQNLLFSNLYFDLNPSTGSDLGFEVQNNNAFIPGVPGNFSTAGTGILHSEIAGTATTPDTIEVAFPWSVFLSDPLSMGYTPATSAVQLRLSQSLGYSVAGYPYDSVLGTADPQRLGTFPVPAAAVPEASSVLVFAIVGLAVAVMAKGRVFAPVVALLK